MREIRFRGKRVDNGEWVYGWLVMESNGTSWISRHFHKGEWEQVNPETVGQFTGLHDKDGQDIYEGDLVRCWGGGYEQGYWEHDMVIEIKDMISDCFMMGEHEFLKVIGNIHEGGTPNE